MQQHIESVEIGGKTITFETGKYAKQANGAVIVRCGDSMVLVTAVCAPGNRPFDFLPLTVDYQDRNGANGTIPGGFLKREGRSSERETLICRVIDRPIRPMFPKHFRSELQIIATAMSYDRDNETDVLALCGASAAFHISDAPLAEPIAGVRICKVDGEFKLNPDYEERNRATIDLIVAGTRTAISMVEGGALEASEEEMLDAFVIAQEAITKIVDTIDALRKVAGVPKLEVAPAPEIDADVLSFMDTKGEAPLVAALAVPGKHERGAALKAARNELIAQLCEGISDEAVVASKTRDAKSAWEKLVRKSMRNTVLTSRTRLDGRAPNGVRDIWCEAGLSPRAHGSAIFTRGETQGYVTLALGTDVDSQRMELPSGKSERHFMLTYNFQPFCTGEARPLRGPKRREVGHGCLARRALLPVLPAKTDFPYVMRSTSEILESNGSSSMATVCGTSLAMMDAGDRKSVV